MTRNEIIAHALSIAGQALDLLAAEDDYNDDPLDEDEEDESTPHYLTAIGGD